MRTRWQAAGLTAALVLATLAVAPAGATAPTRAYVDPAVPSQLTRDGAAEFLVQLQVDSVPPAAATRAEAYRTLTRAARERRAALVATLTDRDIPHTAYWIADTVLVHGDWALLDDLAARPDVARIEPNRRWPLPEPEPATTAAEWGVQDIRAPEVWADFGITGQGITVATVDTGVQFDHPALVNQYRGTATGSHDHHWFDPTGICPEPEPCDNNGFSTHATGVMTGSDGGANQIGVAPGAQWIAAKSCGSNSCAESAMLAAAQWIIAPTDLDGQNPRPDLAPDVVIANWGAVESQFFGATINAWRSAGILPVMSLGSPQFVGCQSIRGLAALPSVYAVTGYDFNHQISSFLPRGPAGSQIKPDIAAPGVEIRSAWPTDTYQRFTGTYQAAAHAAGAAALVLAAGGAVPDLLDQGAIDVPDLTCGGTPDNNNVWGEGRLDAYRAVELAISA